MHRGGRVPLPLVLIGGSAGAIEPFEDQRVAASTRADQIRRLLRMDERATEDSPDAEPRTNSRASA